MELIKTSEKYNPLLKRKELTFLVKHPASASPPLFEVKKNLAALFNAQEEAVYVMKLSGITGTNQTKGEAEIYDDPRRAKQIVPQYIQARNLSTRRKEKKGTAAPAEKKQPSKPA